MPNTNPTEDVNIVGLKVSHQTANGTFTLSSVPCVFNRLIVNTAGTADTITVYDSLTGSGTVLAVINDVLTGTFIYEVACAIGLTIVIAGTTPPDVTVTYRI